MAPPSVGFACQGLTPSTSPSEPALWNDQDVARTYIDVGRHVPALDEVPQPYAIGGPVLLATHQDRRVAVGEVSQAADLNHHVQQRHVLAIWDGLRRGGLPDDPDLLAHRALEAGDDHRHHGVTRVLAQC